MRALWKQAVLISLALASVGLSLLLLTDPAVLASNEGAVVFEAVDPPSAVQALLAAKSFTSMERVAISGMNGSELQIKSKAFDFVLQFATLAGKDVPDPKKGKFLARATPPIPISPGDPKKASSAFPKVSIHPMKTGEKQAVPALKLKTAEKLFKVDAAGGTMLVDQGVTNAIPKEKQLFVHPRNPVKFNYQVKKFDATGKPKQVNFSSPAAAFAQLANEIQQAKMDKASATFLRLMPGQVVSPAVQPPGGDITPPGGDDIPASFELEIGLTEGMATRFGLARVDKVTLCHIPPGNPSRAHTIMVDATDAELHLSKGDFLGPCEGGR